MGNKAILITIGVLVVLNIIGWWLYVHEKSKPVETITKIETRIDTVKIEKPVPVYTKLVSYKFFDFPVESVVYRDSLVEVQVPIEEKVFTDDSTYRATVSGFQPNLEEISIFNRTTTVTQTQLVYKKPIVSVGLGTSAVWNPVTHQFD